MTIAIEMFVIAGYYLTTHITVWPPSHSQFHHAFETKHLNHFTSLFFITLIFDGFNENAIAFIVFEQRVNNQQVYTSFGYRFVNRQLPPMNEMRSS